MLLFSLFPKLLLSAMLDWQDIIESDITIGIIIKKSAYLQIGSVIASVILTLLLLSWLLPRLSLFLVLFLWLLDVMIIAIVVSLLVLLSAMVKGCYYVLSAKLFADCLCYFGAISKAASQFMSYFCSQLQPTLTKTPPNKL